MYVCQEKYVVQYLALNGIHIKSQSLFPIHSFSLQIPVQTIFGGTLSPKTPVKIVFEAR